MASPGGERHGLRRLTGYGLTVRKVWREATGKATQVAVKADVLKTRILALRTVARKQWRPVIVPALMLWTLATVVSAVYLKPFDILEYGRYAHAALHHPLFHRLPLEYPAPAVLVFMFPLIFPLPYPWAFAVVAGIVLLLLVTSYEGSGLEGIDSEAARRLIAYLAIGAVILITGRYDIFAAAAGFWSIRAALQGRWSAAWTWSSVGCVIKLFPAIFWPAFLMAEWRQNGRLPVKRALWMVASGVLLVGLPAIFNHQAPLNVWHYYMRRPTEIESIPAGLSLLADWSGSTLVASYHSVNVVNSWSRHIALVVELLAGVGCLGVWWAQFRNRLPFEAACLATLTLTLLGSKVLSAQYLIWLMPLWALYPLRRLWLLTALGNVVVFPYVVSGQTYQFLPTHLFDGSLGLAFLLRDTLLAWGTWRWLRSVLVDRASPPAVIEMSPSP